MNSDNSSKLPHARDTRAHATNTVHVIPKSFRIRINRAAHDQALAYETKLRDKYFAGLSQAMEQKATYDQLLEMVARVESGTLPATK